MGAVDQAYCVQPPAVVGTTVRMHSPAGLQTTTALVSGRRAIIEVTGGPLGWRE
jgi:hypothetical protein